MVVAGGPDNSISFVYLTPAFITDISQGIAKAIKIDDRAEPENGSSGCEPPQFSSHDLLSVRFSSRHSLSNPNFVRWDFCGQAFATYIEWETHFAVEHIAYEKAQDLSGRKRKQRSDGHWEIMENEFSLRRKSSLCTKTMW